MSIYSVYLNAFVLNGMNALAHLTYRFPLLNQLYFFRTVSLDLFSYQINV